MTETDGHDGHGSTFFGVVGVNPFKPGDFAYRAWQSQFFGKTFWLGMEAMMIAIHGTSGGKEKVGEKASILYVPEHPKNVDEYHGLVRGHMGHCQWVHCMELHSGVPEAAIFKHWQQQAEAQQGKTPVSSPLLLHIDSHSKPAHQTEGGWRASDPLPLVGVTIVTTGYEQMGEEAVKRFQRYTGLPCSMLRCPGDSGFAYKLALPDLVPPVPVVFFDADLWLLRKTDFLPYLAVGGVAGVPDPGTRDADSFVSQDCAKLGLEPRYYFNSGLFIADFSCEHVRAAFRRAAQILQEKESHGIADYGDQTALNMAVQRCGVPFQPMPQGFNFFMHAVSHGYGSVPNLVYGLHAAGVKKADKLAHLKSHAAVFGFENRGKPTPLDPWVSKPVVYPSDDQITSVYEANNDARLPIAYRTERALRWLRERPPHLIQGEALAALKCFLTYRACDGLLSLDDWQQNVGRVEIPQMDEGLSFRWAISQSTAEVYLSILLGCAEYSFYAQDTAFQILNVSVWPAALCNLLRMTVISAYNYYLKGDHRAAEIGISLAMEQWQKTMGGLDWKDKPLRFAEMREDREAILMLLVIAKAIGLTTFKNHDWLRVSEMASAGHPFHRSIREMAKLNPERALWK